VKVRYHGHSCVEIMGEKASIIIDPFINDNPHTKLKAGDINVEYIYITHGHGDHLGDAVEIAMNNNATVIAPYELAMYLSWQGVKTHPLHIGGSFQFDFGRIKAIQAIHGSSAINALTKSIVYLGMPSGVLLEMGGKKLYHAGDTGLYSDMKLLEKEKIDLAFLPIGDNFTMGPEDALLAAEWISAKKTIPIHYNTFPNIIQDPDEFIKALLEKGLNGEVLFSNKWIMA